MPENSKYYDQLLKNLRTYCDDRMKIQDMIEQDIGIKLKNMIKQDVDIYRWHVSLQSRLLNIDVIEEA